jgi:hypothetical protein
MGAPKIKEELYQLIEKGDLRLLKLLYTVAKEYSSEDYTLPGEPMEAEVLKERIRSAKSRIKAGHFTTQEDLEREMDAW